MDAATISQINSQRKSKRNHLIFNLAIFDENQNNLGEIVNISTKGALVQFTQLPDCEAPHLNPGDRCPIQTWMLLSSGEYCKMTLEADVRWVQQRENHKTNDCEHLYGIDFGHSSQSQLTAENIICEMATLV